jgi:hypothetical protein
MKPDCITLIYLKQLSALVDPPYLGSIATSALRIIDDIKAYEMTHFDADCLHWLIEGLLQQDHAPLGAGIQECASNCNICHALAQRIDLPALARLADYR